MVVTSSRLHAVRYKQAFDRYFAEHGIGDLRSLVAFSGTVKDPDTGLEFTEPGMNTDCVTGSPISEKQLPARFASPAEFNEEDRLFFEQIQEKARNTDRIVKLRQANPFDKFQLGLRQMIEDLMIQRISENDKIVTRYMDDKEFGDAAFGVLSKSIYESIPSDGEAPVGDGAG